jgi:hypothetical protein
MAAMGKGLQDKLYETDGRALTWGIVEEMREYIRLADEPLVLKALDERIRRQGGEDVAQELLKEEGTSPLNPHYPSERSPSPERSKRVP